MAHCFLIFKHGGPTVCRFYEPLDLNPTVGGHRQKCYFFTSNPYIGLNESNGRKICHLFKSNFWVKDRSVTNVGKPRSIYKAVVSSPVGVTVTVAPERLIFNSYGQKINFTVHFKLTSPPKGYGFGYLSWKNGKLRVTSPLVVQVAPSDMGLMR